MSTCTIRPSITDEDIDNGRQDDCEECPVALAIARELTAEKFCGFLLSVQRERVVINNGEYLLPPIAVRFIEEFDSGGTVGPFSFALEVERD